MKHYIDRAVRDVLDGQKSFCRFLTANDTGKTGGHQSGICIPKSARSLLFDKPFERGSNVDRRAKITWQGEIVTDSRFIYYGAKTRNEYRITNCNSKNYNPLVEENTGSLLVLIKKDYENYAAWVLTNDAEIDEFLSTFNVNLISGGGLIDTNNVEPDLKLKIELDHVVSKLNGEFPQADLMSSLARQIHCNVYDHEENVVAQPDKELLGWLKVEYDLFRSIEESIYGEQIRRGFYSMTEFLDVANSVMNRRKSRAGKSLEYHLAALFTGNKLPFESQVITEGKKRPDFIFPSEIAYHDQNYDADNLIVLAAKTTCKDRWRQILNEADRVRHRKKYLCTLQHGISIAQLTEMRDERVVLVVPKPIIADYPKEYRREIFSLEQFIAFVRERLSAY